MFTRSKNYVASNNSELKQDWQSNTQLLYWRDVILHSDELFSF